MSNPRNPTGHEESQNWKPNQSLNRMFLSSFPKTSKQNSKTDQLWKPCGIPQKEKKKKKALTLPV